MIPLLHTLRQATRDELREDLVAGLTTAVMLVPQSMAYAMLAGLEPIVGLYASTLPLALYAMFGSSRRLAVGPVALDSLMVAAALVPLALEPGQYAIAAAAMALMVGGIQFSLGLLRAGYLVRLLTQPVVVGFTAGAAVVIGLSQLASALGLALPRSSQAHVIALAAIQKLDQVHLPTLAITLASVVGLALMKRHTPRIPRFLAVVAAATALVWGLDLAQAGVAVVGVVPSGLPTPSIPTLSMDHALTLFPSALAIAAVAMMEALSVSRRYETEVRPDRELLSLGLANLGSGLVGGYPVTGGFSRTAVNAQAGARTPLAGLVTAGVVLLTLLFLTDAFAYLPKAVLASIIISSVAGLVDHAALRDFWRFRRLDFTVAVITLLATLTMGIPAGMSTGLLASLVAWGWRKASDRHAAEPASPSASVR